MQQVYKLNNGKYSGLWGFDTRDTKVTGGTIAIADVTVAFNPSNSIVACYVGSNAALNGGPSAFDKIAGSLDLKNGTRCWGSLWVEWRGGNPKYQFLKKTRTMNSTDITLHGDLSSLAPVPPPAAG